MIILDVSDKRPIYEQVEDRFKELITLGVLKTDEKMPSVRQLAIELSINPNTIQRAYGELERDGFIYTVKGRGNFVADITGMVPGRQQAYFDKLDQVLGQAEAYSLRPEDIIGHINEYYTKGADND